MPGLHLTAEIAERIRAHGADAYPHECCGALLGRDGDGPREILDLLPLPNQHESSPRNRFVITPGDVRRAEVAASERGLELIGWYHSHPDHPALPSEFDREHAWPWYSYVIVSVEKGQAGALASWRLSDDRMRFTPELVDSGAKVAAQQCLVSADFESAREVGGQPMSVKVIIPTALRQFAGKQESLDFSARTVGEALDSLTGRYDELRKHLFADDGRLRSFVNVYVNDEDIRYLSRDQTPVKDGDTISIIPSIAGGIARSGDRVIG